MDRFDNRVRVQVQVTDWHPMPPPAYSCKVEGTDIEIRNLPFPITAIRVSPGTIKLSLRVMNQEFPSEEINVNFCVGAMYSAVGDGEQVTANLALAIRHAIRSVMEHEIDEALFVGGKRVFDPHREEREVAQRTTFR